MIVTILAYKSDSTDICRGCVMTRYSSDFKFIASMDKKIVTEFLAGMLFDNMHLDTGEDGYKFTWLFNGEESSDWDMNSLREEIILKAKQHCATKEAEYQRQKAEKATEAQKKATESQENKEREQLALLSAKYRHP